MSSVLLFALISAFTVGNMAVMKLFEKDFQTDTVHFAWFNVVNASCACVYFFVTNGCKLRLNGPTLIFSVVYAVVVAANLILNIVSFRYVSVSVVGILSTAGSVIVSAVFGVLWLQERLSVRLIAAIVLMTAALLLPFRKTRSGSVGAVGILVCLGFFLIKGIAVVISKLYAIAPDVCDSNSFFCMTNVFILAGSFTAVLSRRRSPDGEKINYFRLLSGKQIGYIILQNVLANVASVLTVVLLKTVDVSLFTVISSSVLLVAGAFLAQFAFREKQAVRNWIAVALAVVAIICAGKG